MSVLNSLTMNSDPSVQQAKKEIRRRIKALREANPWPGSSRIVSRVTELPEWKEARTVLTYFPLPGEVDLRDLFQSEGKRIVLPLVEGDHLLLKEYSEKSLVPGYAGIMEPAADAPDVDPSEIDFALIPGVAFDAQGGRMGRGKGYYDRLLPQLRCPLAGVAFDWQMVEKIPSERWDVRMDIIVSEEIITKPRPTGCGGG